LIVGQLEIEVIMIFDDGGLLKKLFGWIAGITFVLYFGFWSILILGGTLFIGLLLEDILFDTHHFD